MFHRVLRVESLYNNFFQYNNLFQSHGTSSKSSTSKKNLDITNFNASNFQYNELKFKSELNKIRLNDLFFGCWRNSLMWRMWVQRVHREGDRAAICDVRLTTTFDWVTSAVVVLGFGRTLAAASEGLSAKPTVISVRNSEMVQTSGVRLLWKRKLRSSVDKEK